MDAKHKLIVGVNAFQQADEKPLETLILDEACEKEQVGRLREHKASTIIKQYSGSLAELRRVAATKREFDADVD